MSEIFFQDIDDGIGFGIQTCNVPDVALFSSTGYDARILLFTTNFGTPGLENISVGSAFGTSNYASDSNVQNEIYIGHVTDTSNVQKVIVVQGSNVGINTEYPSAALHVVAPSNNVDDAFVVNASNGLNDPTFRIRNDGLIGVGTDPVTGRTMTIKGGLYVDTLTIGGNVNIGQASLITTTGIVSIDGYGDSNYLEFGNNSLCNITNIQLQPGGSLITDTISALTLPENTISFTNATLCNISNIYTNPSSILTIDTINAATDSTSNVYIPFLQSSNLVSCNLLVSQLLGDINVNNYSLCNINTLDVASITNYASSLINFENNTLSNISTLETITINASYGTISNLAIDSLTSLTPSSSIDFQNTSINNSGDFNLNAEATLFTNSITNANNIPGDPIDFNQSSMTNISNLTITGTFNIPGEVIITNTSISATDQLSVQNSGTDTTLLINQNGANKVAEFMYNSNVVLMIKKDGQTFIGNFGNRTSTDAFVNSNIPRAQLYVTNSNTNIAQDTVFIQQPLSGYNTLTLQGMSQSASNSIYFESSGKIGIGMQPTSEPNARIQIAQQYGDATDYLRLTSSGYPAVNSDVFIVNSNGIVGIGINPSASKYADCNAALIVNGTILANTITAQAGSNYVSFNYTNLSNISQLTAQTLSGNGYNITNLNASNIIGIVPSSSIPYASTSSYGITQLVNSVSCNSTVLAATTNSVFVVNSNAQTKVSKYGDTIIGDLSVLGTVSASTLTCSTLVGTLTTSNQPNLSSIGTATNLTIINSTFTASNMVANYYTGTLTTSYQPNLSIIGTSTNLTTNSSTFIASNMVANYFTGTLTTYNQPNLSSIGTVTNLTTNSSTFIASNMVANYYTGILTTQTQPNISSVGRNTNLSTLNSTFIASNMVANYYTGTLITSSQPNLSSIGTSVNLATMNSTFIASNMVANHYTGTLTTSNQPSLRIIGTNANLIDGTSIFTAYNMVACNLTGTVITPLQPYFSSIGTATNLTITNSTFTASNMVANHYTGTLTTSNQPSLRIIGTNANLIDSSSRFTAYTMVACNLTGELTTINQPNISTIGTVVNLTTTNSIFTASNMVANYYTGILTTQTQPNLSSVGTNTNLSTLNSTFIASNMVANYYTGTLITSNQPILSSIGTTTNLTKTNSTFTASNMVANFYSGILTTTRQPNLSIIGTITNLTNIDSTFTAYSMVARYFTGILTTISQPNISILGTNANLSDITSTVTAYNIVGNSIIGTINTASQPNIIRIGTIANLINTNSIFYACNVIATYLNGNGSNITNMNASALSFGMARSNLLPLATLGTTGIVQLYNNIDYSINDINTSNAATAYSVYLANSNATNRVHISGDTMTGNLAVQALLYSTYTAIGKNADGTDISIFNKNTLPSQFILGGGGTIGTAYNSASAPDGHLFIVNKLGIGTSNPQYALDVNGNSRFTGNAEFSSNLTINGPSLIIPVGSNISRPSPGIQGMIRYNTEMNMFEGYGPGSTWSSLGGVGGVGGVINTAGTTYIKAEFAPNANDNNLRFVNSNIETMRITSNGYVGIGTSNPQYALDVNGSIRVSGSIIYNSYISQSNMRLNNLIVNTIQADSSNTVDFTGTDTCNINAINANKLYISQVSSGSATTSNLYSPIDFTASTLCNITNVNTATLTTPTISSLTNEVSFNYNKILDVDSLIVRSNITVSFTGTNTYTNLPSNLVTIDSNTGRILDQYISSNIARLMGDGTINPSMIPVVTLSQSTTVRAANNFGIGTRIPAQKLHVNNGNIALTGGRLGIGISSTPLGALYIYDSNSGVPSFRIDNDGSYDTIHINGPNNIPLFYITSSCNIGIGTSTPQYLLDVNGTTCTLGLRTDSIATTNGNGTIDCTLTSFSNMQNLYVRNLNVSSSMTLPATITSSTYTNQVYTNIISTSTNTNVQFVNAVHISAYDSSLYSELYSNIFGNSDIPNIYSDIGLRVDNNIMAHSLLTISDKRVKNIISISDITNDLHTVLQTPVHTYKLIANPSHNPIVGFIAQEVENIIPSAVNTTTHEIPSIMRICNIKNGNILYYSDTICVDADLIIGSSIKLLYAGKELIRTVTYIFIENGIVEIHIDTSLIIEIENTVFLYGRIVHDFKLINTERLMPYAFNSIKALYETITSQQKTLNSILQRLDAIESGNC